MSRKRKKQIVSGALPLECECTQEPSLNRRICHTAYVVRLHACENQTLLTGYLTELDGIDRNHCLKIIQRTFQRMGLPLSTMTR